MHPNLWITLATIVGFLAVVLGMCAYLILVERKVAAWMQDRIGPNRVGPLGLLQPIADGLKFLFKEEVIPAHVDKLLLPAGADHRGVDGAARGGRGAVRANVAGRPGAVSVRHRARRRHRHPLRLRGHQPGGLRHRAGRLVVATTSTACWARCAPAPSSSATRSRWACRSWAWCWSPAPRTWNASSSTRPMPAGTSSTSRWRSCCS